MSSALFRFLIISFKASVQCTVDRGDAFGAHQTPTPSLPIVLFGCAIPLTTSATYACPFQFLSSDALLTLKIKDDITKHR